MREYHFFDVDGTITSCMTAVQFLFEGIRNRAFPLSPLFSIPALMLKYRGGQLSVEKYLMQGVPFLAGITQSGLKQLAEKTYNKRIGRKIYQGAYTLIRKLQDQGNEVLLATSSIDFVLEPLMRYLGIESGICSSLVFRDGICTGEFNGFLAFGEEKRNLVLAELAVRRIDPAHCYFYSDSINDLPLLLAVGHPVVVNADKKLAAEAQTRNWPVLNFTGRLVNRVMAKN